MNIFKLQAEFLNAGDVDLPGDIATVQMSENLIEEEYLEFFLEEHGDLNKLKECCDLIYVAAQYLNVTVGPDKAALLFQAIHDNNMQKCIDGKLVKREDGKILKPKGFNKDGWKEQFKDLALLTGS